MNQNYYDPNLCYNSNSFGFDQYQPSQYSVTHQSPQEKSMAKLLLEEKLPQALQALYESSQYWKPPIYYDNDDDEDYSIQPEDSLIMGNEELNTIPEKESDEVIKSSVENLVPIPSEFEDTSESDSDCDLPSDDESLSDEDILEDNVKIYSNPLFEFDDEYISSDVNPLFDEVLENIESKDSDVSNFDEPALLVTPLSDANKDECFNPGGNVDEIEFLLHRDPSTPKLSVASILEGFIDEPPLEENDDLFDLESKENEWKKILYDAPIDDLMTEDKDCPDYEDSRARGFVHRSLDLQSFTCFYMGIRYPRSY
ncbi:hypothetical protein Tco_1376879 [Tanacetum coccineum]